MSNTFKTEPVTELKLVLEHAFDIRIDFHQRLIFDAMPGGQKAAYTSVKSGTVSGPRLNGKVLDYSGADWPIVRADGVV
ncbi:MAG: hypothetical protein QOG17_555, partial [Gammaproteobacteria bacterium]|nr:hypothetical protein [Gammaproteobacteria bacterium]